MEICKYIYNFFLCLKYPFLRARNVWTGKKLGYRYTWHDDIDKGWKKAFGKDLLRDMKIALKKTGILKKYRITQIKEKYGTLRIYDAGGNDEIWGVIQKYELLSMCYCMNCGKPVRYMTKGWVGYYCEDCIKHEYKDQEDIDACRLTKKYIPKVFKYIGDEVVEINYKEKYGIDFYKLWDLKE